MKQKKTGFHSNYIDQFYKLFCRLPQHANNRISNVWRMVSPCWKKIASIFFSIGPNQPAWPQICAADHRGLNVVTIYLRFFFCCFALGWQTLPLSISLPGVFFVFFCSKYSNDFAGLSPKKRKKHGEREIKGQTKQMKQLYRSLLDWAEYAYVLLFITTVITVLFYFYFERWTRKKL